MNTVNQLSQVDVGYDRVRHHSAPVANGRIDRMTRGTVADVIAAGRNAIVQRLGELDHEWDIDRALMANFAVLGGASFTIGMIRYARTPLFRRSRKGFLGLFGSQLAFMLLHALAGWCPPATVFRRLGFRTQREINAERAVLVDALNRAA
jgi:hypothetical protein